ncbi:hypothetical protein [Idiomarina xiamenensis]|uniref:Phage abortive infection protein n=1 Tax=Idiomarina xiamenensis 10-D-4 TaxID=740709 RepID=K2KPH9_9GAMM|nr:hypothetical protein [Idiomarina xiamenensis]EKE79450.1 hypothetical protein A10D4_12819 [Idiomarina xiamenensis 10-D-4]
MSKPDRKPEEHPEYKMFKFVVVALLGATVPVIVFWLAFHSYPAGGPPEWAEFATYFSGFATPIIAFCSVLLFFRSLIIQRDEFTKTREEMAKATQLQLETVRIQEKANEHIKIAAEKDYERWNIERYDSFIKKLEIDDRKNSIDLTDFLGVKQIPIALGFRTILHGLDENDILKRLENKNDLFCFNMLLANYFTNRTSLAALIIEYPDKSSIIKLYGTLIMSLKMERDFIISLFDKLRAKSGYDSMRGDKVISNYKSVTERLFNMLGWKI